MSEPFVERQVDQDYGWLGASRPDILREAFDLWGQELARPLKISGTLGERPKQIMLPLLVRKVNGGKDYRIYRQEIGDCHDGDSVVFGEAVKKIKDVKVGDVVWTGEGKLTRVITTRELETHKPMVKIKVEGGLPTTCTADHQFLVYRSQYERAVGESCKTGRAEEIKNTRESMEPVWVSAGDLTTEDYLLAPVSYESVDAPDDETLSTFWNDDFGRWVLGYFIGDGSANGGTVEFSVNERESSDLLVEGLTRFGYNPTVNSTDGKKSDKSWRVRVHSRKLVALIQKYFYDDRKEKVFPAWAIGDRRFVRGLFDTRKSENLLHSTSLSVVYGVLASLRSMGYDPTLDDAKPLYAVKWTEDEQTHRIWRDDQFVCHRVLETEFLEGPHTVYDIGVEDDHHSFIANGFATHNCVGHGSKHGVQCMQALPIINGERFQFTEIHPSYTYGTGRVQIGGTTLGLMDGSTGIWAAKAVNQYGAIAYNTPNAPEYSGSVSKKWGRSPGPPTEFLTEGKKHLVKTTALVNTLDQLDEALVNGYGSNICSNYGFKMKEGSSRFHEASGTWAHSMSVVGVDFGGDGIPKHYIIQNSWGDVHGTLMDLRNPEVQLPLGCLRVRPEVIAKMIAQNDTYAYSFYNGFPAQKLPRELFDLW